MNSFNINQILPCIHKQQFRQCIGQLTYLIENTSLSAQHTDVSELLSTLYLNRGTIELREGRSQQALSDMNRSLEFNHLNYATYYNLFSLKYSNEQKIESLKQLCCGLSCLYLMRGRIHHNQHDINMSIKYCENNTEARIAKALAFLTNKKLNLALNEVRWVLDIRPNDLQAQKICSKLQKIMKIQIEESSLSISMPRDLQSDNRLICSLFEQEQLLTVADIDSLITQKLTDFNQIFSELNSEPITILKNTHLLFKKKGPVINSNIISQSKQEVTPILIEQNRKYLEEFGQISSVKLSQQPSITPSRNNFTFSYNRDNTELQSGITLQTGQHNKKIIVKVDSIHLSTQNLSAQHPSNLYCRFQYGNILLKSIDSSHQEKKVEDQSSTQCQKDYSIITVKVYKKQIQKFHDRFIGKGSKEVGTIGKVSVPIFSQETDFVGEVSLDVSYK